MIGEQKRKSAISNFMKFEKTRKKPDEKNSDKKVSFGRRFFEKPISYYKIYNLSEHIKKMM